MRTVCVELTDALGEGSCEHLQPLDGERGVVLVPIDRATISLVWSEGGYPAGGAYRDYHRLTTFHHNPWNNAGGAYEHDAALALARAHAADFVTRVRERLREAAQSAPGPLPGGGLVVCAIDTELLGHWWYEGVAWLGGRDRGGRRPGPGAGASRRGAGAERPASAAGGVAGPVARHQLGARGRPLDLV